MIALAREASFGMKLTGVCKCLVCVPMAPFVIVMLFVSMLVEVVTGNFAFEIEKRQKDVRLINLYDCIDVNAKWDGLAMVYIVHWIGILMDGLIMILVVLIHAVEPTIVLAFQTLVKLMTSLLLQMT